MEMEEGGGGGSLREPRPGLLDAGAAVGGAEWIVVYALVVEDEAVCVKFPR